MLQCKYKMANVVDSKVVDSNVVDSNVVDSNVVDSNVVEPTVSIVTITQYSRRECLANLSMLIKAQIYKNIVEWVIVEGTQDKADSIKNTKLISVMKSDIPINFITWSSGQPLSNLRNSGNEACRGDIIVCMDDDDYYPPTRITHAVYMLQKSTALLAGCSAAYIYFYSTGQFFQFKGFGKRHSINNCLAYKRAYLLNHAYAPNLLKAEETSFTNGFSEPMVQLDPGKTIVISGHATNTVDKAWMIAEQKMLTDARFLNTTILDYMPLPLLLKMEKIFEEMT
jgi:hypothetical protein